MISDLSSLRSFITDYMYIYILKLSTGLYAIFNKYLQFLSLLIDFLLVLSFESRKAFSGCHRLCLASVFRDFAAF